MAKCVVLHSLSKYSVVHEPFLREILTEKPDLFAVTGVDCQAWEDAMDWLCVDLDVSKALPGAFCNTTSHPGEALPDVVAFAEQWCSLNGWPVDVRVVEI